jgi:TP901 family phage tail tape measure protein
MTKTFSLIANESDVTKNKLQKDVRELSRTYGIAAKVISGALYEIISAQVGVANASDVLERAIQLSIAGGADVRTSANSLVQIANAYGMSFDKVRNIADLAFQTIKYGQLTIQQYTEQMSKVVATASILKIPIEEVSAAIATMTINGINAEQAFTALNQMFMQIATPTSKAKKLMSELGIDLSINKIQAEGLESALQELVPLLSMTGEAQEQLITVLFKNRTGFKAVSSLLGNMSEYTENYYRMIDAAGAAQEALAERTNTVAFAQNRMNAAWQEMQMIWASGYNREIISFYDYLTGAINILIKSIPMLTIAIKTFGLVLINQLIKKAVLHFKVLQTQIKILGHEFSVTWAKATLGLSLLISGIIELGIVASGIANKIKKNDISKALGLDELAKSAENAENQI